MRRRQQQSERRHSSEEASDRSQLNTSSALDNPEPVVLHTFSQTVDWDVALIEDALQAPAPGLHVPISIFSGEQPVLQALVRYLREQFGMPFQAMAEQLGRGESTLRATYRNARWGPSLIIDDASPVLPLALFLEYRLLSPLEVVVLFLLQRGLRNVEVAALLNLDPRTTATVKRRIREKGVVLI